MLYHEILLVPGTGHFGRGVFDPGLNCGTYFEFELARDLITVIAEELDNDRVRARVIDAWNPPGVSRPLLASQSELTTLSIHFLFGGPTGAQKEKQATVAYSSDPVVAPLARILCDAASDWGACCNFEHMTLGAKAKPGFFPHHAVIIEPFSLATIEREVYVPRLKVLGQTLARTLADYMQRGRHAQRSRPLTAWENDKTKPSEDRSLVGAFFAAMESGCLDMFANYDPDTSEKDGAKPDSPQDKPQGDNDSLKHATPPLDPATKAHDSDRRAGQKKADRQSGNAGSKARSPAPPHPAEPGP